MPLSDFELNLLQLCSALAFNNFELGLRAKTAGASFPLSLDFALVVSKDVERRNLSARFRSSGRPSAEPLVWKKRRVSAKEGGYVEGTEGFQKGRRNVLEADRVKGKLCIPNLALWEYPQSGHKVVIGSGHAVTTF
ncbi:hypothetical protein AXG93_3114s1090 [Marchantia polymorpha subsp. ruderalis]|uniref:Uncharacterized protein n=1 Tax=Marchantia polymorpha subsp. ruderalis TaxID=1480154 RepID=A0A176WAZ5_MARPO|nr:hypothetical protein AXG93_3114s1090 [Marchantia polymorpha subsp. ruderalis]